MLSLLDLRFMHCSLELDVLRMHYISNYKKIILGQ